MNQPSMETRTSPSPQHRLKEEWLKAELTFACPQWHTIWEWFEKEVPPDDWEPVVLALAEDWAQRVAKQMGADYVCEQSPHFLLVSKAGQAKCQQVFDFLESCWVEVLTDMAWLQEEDYMGKCPVFIFADPDQFCQYLADYDRKDPAYRNAWGVYINDGYGHIAVNSDDLKDFETVLIVQLSHVIIAPMQLPIWLDEGMTQEVQRFLTKSKAPGSDKTELAAFWTNEKLPRFWNGEAFRSGDAGENAKAIALALEIIHYLRSGKFTDETLTEFIRNASFDDKGEKAANKYLQCELDDLVRNALR